MSVNTQNQKMKKSVALKKINKSSAHGGTTRQSKTKSLESKQPDQADPIAEPMTVAVTAELLRDNIINQHRLSGDSNNLSTDDIFRLLDLYFHKEFYAYRHLHDSYDRFVDDTVPRFLMDVDHVFHEAITDEQYIKHKLTFANIRIESPKHSNDVDPMFPADARHLALAYNMIVYADVTQSKQTTDINATGEQRTRTQTVGKTEPNRPVMIIPMMVRSKYCNLNIYPDETQDECRFDPGGYFIVNGSEKVVICQDRMLYNSPIVFVKKNSSIQYNVVQVNSKSPNLTSMMQAVSVKIKKDNMMLIKIPFLQEVNVMIIFRALGVESDKMIVDYCAYDQTDYHMIEMIRVSLDGCVNDNTNIITMIQTREEAIEYLIGKMKVVRKYTESDQATKMEQKKLHLMELMRTCFLPHIQGTQANPFVEKAYYLGYMVNRLLSVQLKRNPVDNRDSYCKKRIDNIRELLEEIMLQQYKTIISECNKQFIARMGDDAFGNPVEPYNIIHQFKAGTFEQGFKASLMLGNWPRKKGVSQMLTRMSYMLFISYLSRVDSQSGTQASSKLTKPRHIDPSSLPFLCLAGNSEVLMRSNQIQLIDRMRDGDVVRTFCRDTLVESNTPITRYFSQPATQMRMIRTISGRVLECTPNHPIYVSRDRVCQMIRADELLPSDLVLIRHTEKYIAPQDITYQCQYNEPIVSNPDTDEHVLEYLDEPKLMVSARIIGLILRQSDPRDTMYVRVHTDDLCGLLEDIAGLGFELPRVSVSHDTATVWFSPMSSRYFEAMIGTKKAGHDEPIDSAIPWWVLHASPRVQREFLSTINTVHEVGNPIAMPMILGKSPDMTARDVMRMFYTLGIDGSVAMDGDGNPTYQLTQTAINMARYVDYIGTRYHRPCLGNTIEYTKYLGHTGIGHTGIGHTGTGYTGTGTDHTGNSPMTREEFNKICEILPSGLVGVPIESIQPSNPTRVYDFTTQSNTHTFIANGFVVSNCPIQTPEHAKIGLIKHMTLIASLTIGDADNTELVREFITTYPAVQRIYDVPADQLKHMYKVFLNGEWIGVIRNIYQVGDHYQSNPVVRFYGDAKVKKLQGSFNPQMTSICFDHKTSEIRFNTDSGRLYRPVLRVNGDNELMLTKAMIDQISLRATDKGKISDWDEFYMQSPYPIEFVDSEEQPYHMIAEDIKQLGAERKKIIGSAGSTGSTGSAGSAGSTGSISAEPTNRYDESFFDRYDSMELHPSVLLGEIATNIPFCNRNEAPRNIFQYAQGRQTMGIYCTTYRARTDISYVLYNPEVPLVNTRTSKYTYTDVLPPGSNAVVAIACYSGYNQEDSLIFNKTALQRGLFRSMNLKKYTSSITKNQDTSGDDKFMKPPPDKTIGIKNGQYDKMNEQGFIPEETPITNGDVIFGKVTPIADQSNQSRANTGKIFKDSSEQYKSHADGVVDRVYVGIKNHDGYETRKALIRSERMPHIGDKFCSRMGQKGTLGIPMESIDMPFTRHGIRPDIIMNPNAIPSRMTIGQLWECLVGKVGAIRGTNMDGTAFEEYDINGLKDMLESMGYQRNAEEYLYNGMTSKKLQHMIFIGPTYYQRLKHMVQDKLHSRSRGPVTILTHQAPEGRSRDGGLRLGEMERDAIIAHGMAKFLKERLMECSDQYHTFVCGRCGLFARREDSRNNQPFPDVDDVYYCSTCNNYTDIHQIQIPYAFKLMIQELLAMSIAPRIRI
jgi:DNA-directed RNA polymerase beta subunit